MPEPRHHEEHADFDYIVVGAGAGGGPLAANLAEAGMRVLLIDAGGDVENDNYLVPAFHADASEDPVQRWDYFVRHDADEEQQRRDSKLVPGKGVLYPRAGTVGGCTAHHALITVCPYNRDWDEIADETGDPSWRSSAMRTYFERLERCGYRPRPKVLPANPVLARLVRLLPLVSDRYANKARHGFDGWLPTQLADPGLIIKDTQLLNVILAAAEGSLVDFTGVAQYVDSRIGWDKLPLPFGLATLLGLRVKLRQDNLHDTNSIPAVNIPEPAPPSPTHKVNRTADGSHNDLESPRTGTHLERPGVRQRTLVVDCAGVRITDFGIAPDERDALVEEGRRAAGEFLQRWRASGGA